jgi:xylulokinase
MQLVAGVDSSTQSCKLEVRDAESGELVRAGHRPHPPTMPPRSEQDPGAWWDALSSLLEEHGDGVGAISVAGQQHGMVVLDDECRVLRPAKLWNDTESAPQAAALVADRSARWWADTVGSVPVASFTVTKLAWLRDHEPDVFERVAHVLLPHDWLTLQLTGNLVTDRGDASGTGYWSAEAGAYVTDVFAMLGLDPDVAPTVLSPRALAGHRREMLVGAGTGDNMGAALGLGLKAGDVAISLGTSGTVFAVSTRATSDDTGAVAGFADATGRFLPLVCTLNATMVTETMARLLGCSREEFETLALAAPAGAGGVTVVPYFDGERTPNLPDATGGISGLRSGTSREQLARAAYEGVVCNLLDAFDALRVAGVPTDTGRVFLVGGGARSVAYRRILADLLQRPVHVPAPAEYVARGAARQAAAVLLGRDVTEVAAEWSPADTEIVEPDTTVDAAAVRDAYATAAHRGYGARS